MELAAHDSCSTMVRTHHSCTLASSLFSSGCQDEARMSPCFHMTTSFMGPAGVWVVAAVPRAGLAGATVARSLGGRRTRHSTGGGARSSSSEVGSDDVGGGGRSECSAGAQMKVASRGGVGGDKKSSTSGSANDWS